jgi:D-alanyl-lipoteichoic acid acyltransferase DltB (MBOAT superfamily)
VNFNLPYVATNPREFWRRWHISLSTWLRDYLYIPLGGNRKGRVHTYRNIAITMLLGGLWHGAAWTFVLWGAYQGALLIVHRALEPVFKIIPSPKTGAIEKIWRGARIVFFFHLVCLGWLLFRAQTLEQMMHMFHSVVFNFHIMPDSGIGAMFSQMISYLIVIVTVQVVQYWKNDPMVVLKSNIVVRTIVYYLCLVSIAIGGVINATPFIYFQF